MTGGGLLCSARVWHGALRLLLECVWSPSKPLTTFAFDQIRAEYIFSHLVGRHRVIHVSDAPVIPVKISWRRWRRKKF